MPAVSVVIPSYNHARFIDATLASLASQTYRDFEIVVVDDGSGDQSLAIIKQFAETSAVPVVVVAQANAGAHAAINRGIERASGDHLAILNSDDRFAPDRLERMMAVVPAEGDYIAFSELELIDENGRAIPDDPHNVWYREILGVHDTLPGLGYTLIISNLAATTSNFLFSRSLYEKVGPFRPYRTAHDLDFILRCVPLVEPIFLRTCLLSYRIHPQNTINLNRDVERGEVRAIYDDYVRSVALHPPKNERAPGSRTMPSYSAYFLTERDHWSGPHPTGDLLEGLAAALRACPVSDDARALRLEVGRLNKELAGCNASRDAARDLLALTERDLAQARSSQARAADQLQSILRSTSWTLTRPVRQVTEAVRRVLRG